MMRKNIYMQLAPICDVERKHDGFLLHFNDGSKARVKNATEAREEALAHAKTLLTTNPDRRDLTALVTELERFLEERAA